MDAIEQEFTAMIKQYKSTIYSVCMMYADRPEDTDDLVQEALIHLWKGFPPKNGLTKAWVWKVTMNSCISADRKRRHWKDECPLAVSHEDIESAENGKKNAQVRMLYDRIHSLNPFDRAIVMLWLEGMPYDEIGMIVGISAKNVSVKLVRIKEQLKRMSHGE
ncbi:MAG: sigma-70 family RNA polymerase sigma factor [Bacteroidales bacterium]|nr:sigma-70 family RNA polymerase sigma factor [Candidatus Cryptobacteroides onthequi]